MSKLSSFLRKRWGFGSVGMGSTAFGAMPGMGVANLPGGANLNAPWGTAAHVQGLMAAGQTPSSQELDVAYPNGMPTGIAQYTGPMVNSLTAGQIGQITGILGSLPGLGGLSGIGSTIGSYAGAAGQIAAMFAKKSGPLAAGAASGIAGQLAASGVSGLLGAGGGCGCNGKGRDPCTGQKMSGQRAPTASLFGGCCPPGRVLMRRPWARDICAKKRTMNPFNPAALARADRRVTSFARRSTVMLKDMGFDVSRHRKPKLHKGRKRARR